MPGKESIPAKKPRYFNGRQLIDRWGIHPKNLSDCMVVGLQPYHPDDLAIVADPYRLDNGKIQSARSYLVTLSGLSGGIKPERFQSSVSPLGPIYFLPLWLRDEQDDFFRLRDTEDYCALNKENLIESHMELLFKADDIERFEQVYGLRPCEMEVEDSAIQKDFEITEDYKDLFRELAKLYDAVDRELGKLWVDTDDFKNRALRIVKRLLSTHPGYYPTMKDYTGIFKDLKPFAGNKDNAKKTFIGLSLQRVIGKKMVSNYKTFYDKVRTCCEGGGNGIE